MGIDVKTYAAARKYTDKSMQGGGAVAGKNCVISSITPITGGNRVTFQWTLDNGTVQQGTMDVMDGAKGDTGAQGPAGADGQDGTDGLGIKSVEVNAEDHLIITYDDDTTEDAGAISVTAAVDSVNGKTGDVELTASDVGALPDDTEIPSKISDLQNDSNFIETSATEGLVKNDGTIDPKTYVEAVAGKGLSTNDYDNTAKAAVDGLSTALDGKVDKETGKSLIDLTTVVDGASYDSTNHQILFKNGTTTLFSLDAAAFVKDGMVDTVTITGGNLVITFNTDAGKQAISIPLTDIFDPANYYTKTATDGLLADKADKVTSAVSGNFAGLDANGNLTDSGKKASDFGVYRYQKKINNTASQSTNPKYIELSGVYSTMFVSNTLRVSLGSNEVVDIVVSTNIQSQPQIPKIIRYHTPNTPKLQKVWYNLTTQKIVLEIGQYTWAQIDHISGIPTTITDQIIQSVDGYTAVDESNVQYSIPSATNNNLVAMDANGNIVDSNISSNDVRKTTMLSNNTGSEAIFKISGFGLNSGSLFVIRARGGENILFALGNTSQDVEVSYGYSAFRVLGSSGYKINAMTYDYANNELYINLGNYSALSIIQISGTTKYDLTITSVNSIPTTDIYEIPIQNLNSKIDKVASATSGNLASLDANGNLADSGIGAGGVLTAKGTINESIDFNTIVAPGVYGFGSQNYIVNGPTGATYGVLTVFCTRNANVLYNYIIQIYKNRADSKSWHRLSTNGGTEWTDWFYSSTASEGTAALLAAGTDTTQRSWTAKMLRDEFAEASEGVPAHNDTCVIPDSSLTRWVKSGRIVMAEVEFVADNGYSGVPIASSTDLFSDFPVPAHEIDVTLTDGATEFTAALTTSGALKNMVSLTADHRRYSAQFQYISAS